MKQYLLQLKKENQLLFGSGYNKNDYICKWVDGKPLSPDYVSHRHKYLLEKNGLEVIRFHDLSYPNHYKIQTFYQERCFCAES